MNCPCCHAKTRRGIRPDGEEGPICPECGWGSEAPPDPSPEPPSGAGFYVRYGLMWVLTVIVVAGPYVGLRWLFLELGELGPMDEALRKLNLHYGWVLLVYLALCRTVSPRYDRGNLGIFGGNPHSRYNPAWTPEQHYNRFMHTLSMILVPGKIVVATLEMTRELLVSRRS